MKLEYGIGHEGIKYVYGNDFEDAWQRVVEKRAHGYFLPKSLSLVTARNDFADFQVFLRGDNVFELAVTDTAAFTPIDGADIVRMKVELDDPSLQVTCYPEGLMECDDALKRADVLLPKETVTVGRMVGQPVYVRVWVPADYARDAIQGRVLLYQHNLFEDERLVGELEVSIQVHRCVMPDAGEYPLYLNLWQHPSNLARHHEVPLWSDAHFAILENYTRCLADLGEKVITVVVSEIPWSGQRCYKVHNYPSNLYEYSAIAIRRDKDGVFHYDYTALDRYIRLCMACGIDREIEMIGLCNIWYFPQDGFGEVAPDYPDAIRLRYLDEGDGTYHFMRHGDDIRYYIAALQQHMEDMGWLDITRVMADEPANIERYRASIQEIKRVAPKFKLKAAINHAEFIEQFQHDIQGFVPGYGSLVREYDRFQHMNHTMKNNRFLWYVAVGEFPDNTIRANLMETRAMGWLTDAFELEGFLRWNFTVWPDDPRRKIAWNYTGWPAGETNFVYPGANGQPVLSLRYIQLKRGFAEHALIQRVRALPDGQAIVHRAFAQLTDIPLPLTGESVKRIKAGDFAFDFDAFERAKKVLLDALV
nr:DUF4091 domain-containing protein [bacterium]